MFRRAPLFTSLIAFRELNSERGNNQSEENNNGSARRTNFRIISATAYSPNSQRNNQIAPQPTINSDEIRETIAQNLVEVQNLIDFGNYKEFNENEEEKNINIKKNEENIYDMNCFDLNKRIFYKGQWVDVKDTIEQWLDAQVIEVSEDNKMVKIHYNEWSTRWDEWIETNSPRIMPFRYHTRQSTLTNYHSPFPNKKPDMGITLLSFENINRNSCIHPFTLNNQRNRNSSVISTSTQTENLNINNNADYNTNNDINNNNNINNNSNINNNISNSNIDNINIGRSQNNEIYAEILPPNPSPGRQDPDPNNHILKNLGEDGFLGIFNEFNKINNVIGGLSSELLSEYTKNTEKLTSKKLCEIQNKSYYNIKRLIPLLDRTGRIYSDISTFIEHSMKTNKLELLSKNIFSDVGKVNKDLRYFSENERSRITNEILSHNSRRENRSGTLNLVPPINNFETKLINTIPIIDTPYMTRKNDPHYPQIYDYIIEDNNNINNNEEEASLIENNNNNDRNELNNTNGNLNFIRNNMIESFHIEFEGGNKEDKEKEKKINNKRKKKKIKKEYKLLGNKIKRNKSIKNMTEKEIKKIKKK